MSVTSSNAQDLLEYLTDHVPSERTWDQIRHDLGMSYQQFGAAKSHMIRGGLLLDAKLAYRYNAHTYGYAVGSEALGTNYWDEREFLAWTFGYINTRVSGGHELLESTALAFPTTGRKKAFRNSRHYAENLEFEAQQMLASL